MWLVVVLSVESRRNIQYFSSNNSDHEHTGPAFHTFSPLVEAEDDEEPEGCEDYSRE